MHTHFNTAVVLKGLTAVFGACFWTEDEIVVLNITFMIMILLSVSKALQSSVQTLVGLKHSRKPPAGPAEEDEDEDGVFNEQNYIEALGTGTQGEMVKL